MTDFETWFNELISDTRWYEVTAMHNKGKNFKLAAQRVYADTVAEGNQGFSKPMPEFRKHVYNKLVRMDFDRIFPTLQQETKEEVKQDWKPVSEEERQRRLKEFKALIDGMPIINNFPRVGYKETIDNGGWLPAKQGTYPVTSPDEAYVKRRHLEYIKANYEPRTGNPLPGWIEESEFNLLYDEKLL